METNIPLYTQGAILDLNLVKHEAAQRALPSVLEQRRDEQGQFMSYKDVPARTTPNDTSIRDAVPGTELAR